MREVLNKKDNQSKKANMIKILNQIKKITKRCIKKQKNFQIKSKSFTRK